VLVLLAAGLAHWRDTDRRADQLERAAQMAEQRASQLELQTRSLAESVAELQAQKGPMKPGFAPRSARDAGPASGSERSGTAAVTSEGPSGGRTRAPSFPMLPEDRIEQLKQNERRVFERIETEFKLEPDDRVWGQPFEQALDGAFRAAAPAAQATINSIAARSTLCRIDASFASLEDYSRFTKAVFFPKVDPSGVQPAQSPLFNDYGGGFVPSLETAPDGTVHAIFYLERAHAPTQAPGSRAQGPK
jgi:hypothetical protein